MTQNNEHLDRALEAALAASGEIERLRTALEAIAGLLDDELVDYGETLDEMCKIARTALKQEEG